MEETQQRKLLDFYELGDTIGNGGFGSVYAGISRLNGDSVSTFKMSLAIYMYCNLCDVLHLALSWCNIMYVLKFHFRKAHLCVLEIIKEV